MSGLRVNQALEEVLSACENLFRLNSRVQSGVGDGLPSMSNLEYPETNQTDQDQVSEPNRIGNPVVS